MFALMEALDGERLEKLASMLLVGALWGCTNPLIKKGTDDDNKTDTSGNDTFFVSSLKTFLNVRVWFPYLLNQLGSVVFYLLLATSDMSMTVPTCNALALIFSIFTSLALGEKFEKPLQTILGSSLVVIGVTICVVSS